LHSSGTGTNVVFVRSTFDIYYASGSKDSFGYSIYSTTGYNLMNFMFTPTTLSNGATAYNFGIQSGANDTPYYTDGLEIQTLKSGAAPLFVLPNSWTDLGFAISGIGTTNQSVSLYTFQGGATNYYGTTKINYSDFSSSAYNDGNTNVGAVGMSWFIKDGTANQAGNLINYGDNTMLVQNLTVAIPEPKTWMLLGLSGLIMVVALRGKKA
jgi:hypothetical protein